MCGFLLTVTPLHLSLSSPPRVSFRLPKCVWTHGIKWRTVQRIEDKRKQFQEIYLIYIILMVWYYMMKMGKIIRTTSTVKSDYQWEPNKDENSEQKSKKKKMIIKCAHEKDLNMFPGSHHRVCFFQPGASHNHASALVMKEERKPLSASRSSCFPGEPGGDSSPGLTKRDFPALFGDPMIRGTGGPIYSSLLRKSSKGQCPRCEGGRIKMGRRLWGLLWQLEVGKEGGKL